MVTQLEAKDMRDAIRLVEQVEAQAARAQQMANIAQAEAWYNTIEKPVPTTRQEALDKFNHIKSLLETETDSFRKSMLFSKLEEANEKYKEVKKVNPNS